MKASTKPSSKTAAFSTGQALEWADLSGDTLRYWKGILEPIAGRDGRSSGYTLEEIVALAVIARATGKLQVPIATFAKHAKAVFDAVAAYVADDQQPSLMFIHESDVGFGSMTALPPIDALAIVRIDRVLLEVRTRMTAPATPPPQLNLFQFGG